MHNQYAPDPIHSFSPADNRCGWPFLRRIVLLAGLALPAITANAANVLYVDQHNSTPPDPYEGFTDWSRAATNIQEAVDAANSGDTILVRNPRVRKNQCKCSGQNFIWI